MSGNDPSQRSNDEARKRAVQLFRFLKDFDERRNPVQRDVREHEALLWWKSLPSKPNAHLSILSGFDEAGEDRPDESAAVESVALLRVRRPLIPAAPSPPGRWQPWLRAGWDDPTQKAAWFDERDTPDEGRIVLPPEGAADLLAWQSRRDVWATRYADDFRVAKVFEWLWERHEVLKREAERYELVLADGHLVWELDRTRRTNYPLLSQRLDLEFDASVPEFRLVESTQAPAFASAVLRAAGADAVVVHEFMAAAADESVHPMAGQSTNAFLKRLAPSLHLGGEMIGYQVDAPPPTTVPVIYRQRVVVLRRRSVGLTQFIEGCIDSVEGGDALPDALRALLGVHDRIGADASPVGMYEQGDESEDILLTKEANREQLEIARRIERYGSVLVQGPPGTGKTHTIANLIGHLLAQGQTVLVTSHTTKALRVLRDKVVPNLQPLCVSVLEGDAEANAQLADAATTIANRLTSGTEEELMRDAEMLHSKRNELLRGIADTRARLLNAVASEFVDIAVAGTKYKPIEAAELVAKGVGADSWIPGNVVAEQLPLKVDEVRELYSTNERVSAVQMGEIMAGLPDIDSLPDATEFADWCERHTHLSEMAANFGSVWQQGYQRAVTDLQRFLDQALVVFATVELMSEWEADAAFSGGTQQARQPWQRLLAALHSFVEADEVLRLNQRLFGIQVENSGLDAEKEEAAFAGLAGHVAAGGHLGRLQLVGKGDWKAVLNASSCFGNRPRTAEEFAALRSAPRARIAFREVRERWSAMMSPFGVELPSDHVQSRDLIERLEQALALREGPLAEVIEFAHKLELMFYRALGVPREPRTAAELRNLAQIAVDRLPAIVLSEQARIELAELTDRQRELVGFVSGFPLASVPASTIGAVQGALLAWDRDSYSTAYSRLRDLHERKEAASRRSDLLPRLERVAPEWALAIRGRVDGHGGAEPPGDIDRAWRWKILADEVDRRAATPVTPLIQDLGLLKLRLRETTGELIDRLAWAAQMRRTDDATRAALVGYVQTIKKIGRGTGRRVPMLRREAQRSMTKARAAVPVWIAPLSRVVESFSPKDKPFDVVIIDEASQLDNFGLLAWKLGSKVVVVGDDQQVTPDAVGESLDTVEDLIDMYLRDLPERHLFDAKTSIYDHASRAFQGVVKLREHFRCVPQIIQFSNLLSYNGEIIPLREPSDAHVHPPVVHYRVEEGVRIRDVNKVEAAHVASLLVSALEQPEYARLTFGVISLFGSTQSPEVEMLLRQAISPEEYENRKIICGLPAHFQGDERDVVFLSLVDSHPPGEGPHRLRRDDAFKKRYNVSVSRARDQVWVVHSLDRTRDLQTEDLRRRLLDFAEDPEGFASGQRQAVAQAESPFEIAVINRLTAAGYTVEAQYPAGGFRIDLVVSDGEKRLAVECDGKLGHSEPDDIRRDLDRQALLERNGWTFHRIRGTAFYRDPDTTMEDLFNRLSVLGIRPVGHEPGAAVDVQNENSLLRRVLTRAQEIRDEWQSTGIRPPAQPRRVSPNAWRQAEDEQLSADHGGMDSDELPPSAPSQRSQTEEQTPETTRDSGHAAGLTDPYRLDGPHSPSLGGRFPPYVEADLSGFRTVGELHLESDRTLHPMLLEVARVEGPVHFELVLERLRHRYGIQRAGNRIRERVIRSLDRLASSGAVQIERRDAGYDLFVWMDATRTPAARGPAIMGLRRIMHVAPQEIEAAVRDTAFVHGASYRDDLIRLTRDALGYGRTGAEINRAIDAGIDRLMRQGAITEHFGRLFLA